MMGREIQHIDILSHFKRQYKNLPIEIQKIADEATQIFKNNPHDSRLRTHKLTNFKSYWAFSVTNKIRIIFEFGNNKNVFFYSIGSHDDYKKI